MAACVLFKDVAILPFELFDNGETGVRVVTSPIIAGKLVGNEPIGMIACVLFKDVDILPFELFDNGEIGGRILVVFRLITGAKLLGKELFETLVCVLFKDAGKL